MLNIITNKIATRKEQTFDYTHSQNKKYDTDNEYRCVILYKRNKKRENFFMIDFEKKKHFEWQYARIKRTKLALRKTNHITHISKISVTVC
jgi:hypothetical protein